MKRGLLFTITTFVIFLALFTFVSFTVQQKNQNMEFANKLSALNNVFYHYDSMEYWSRQMEQGWIVNVSVTYPNNTTNFTLSEHFPLKYSDIIYRFHRFVINMASLNTNLKINAASNLSQYTLSPHNMTVDNHVASIDSTFQNNSNSVGKLKNVTIYIVTDDNIPPGNWIDDSGIQLGSGNSSVNFTIYVNVTGIRDVSWSKNLDPQKQSFMKLKFTSFSNHNGYITFGPVGEINVSVEEVVSRGREFYYTQTVILDDYGKVNINSFSSIIVNNTDYGVFKNSTVSVII